MFNDQDPVEQKMSIRVEEMTPAELTTYVMESQARFGLHLVIEDPQDRKIFQAMQKLYGKQTAGQIVKWVFYKHGGKWDREPVRFGSFSKGRKWWTDMMHLELQQYQRRSDRPVQAGGGTRRIEI